MISVTGVVGRAETLSSIFFIGSLLAYSAATRKLLPRPYGPLHSGSASCSSCVQGGNTCTSTSNGSPSQGVGNFLSGSSSCVGASSLPPNSSSIRQYHHHNTNNSSHHSNSNNHHHHRNGVGSYNVLSSANGLGVGSCFNSYVQPTGGGGPRSNSARYGVARSSSGSRSGGRTRWRWLGLSVALASCAMLCKEQGITVMAVCALYELVIVQKVRGWDLIQFGEGLLSGKGSVPPWLADCAPRMFALVATTLGLMLARVHIMGAQLPVFTR
ncbi:hypothetical protein FHG87_010141 [Trinorchestia longiramus]|nr:hypothetical protein FHG87_010141 [Trinorchestia longiramus]